MCAMDFASAYAHGFARVAAVTLPVSLADPDANAQRIIEQARRMHDESVAVALFPELSITGYSIDDLLLQDVLLDAAEAAVLTVAEATRELLPLIVIGAPLRHGTRLYNCAIVIHRGEILGVAPKSFLPNYREFYEKRHFAAGDRSHGQYLHRPHWPGADADGDIPFGPDLLFQAADLPRLIVHAEVCEDMWVPVPPSHLAALAGATVLVNLSASPITVGRARDRHLLAQSASSRCNAAYAYAAAMAGESSTDLSWDGMTMIYEGGALLAQTERFPEEAQASILDVDLDALVQERIRQGSFDDNARALGVATGGAGGGTMAGGSIGGSAAGTLADYRTVPFTLDPPTGDIGLRRAVDRFPFVPDDPEQLAQDCYEAYNIQVSALEQRLRAMSTDTWQPSIVIGVSGGLDSTHALIVAAKAMDRLGRPRTDILGFTMPGFATSDHTKNNAIELMKALGITWAELDIRATATQMLRDMDHPFGRGEEVYDVTFENVQAGLRTDYLFRIANQRGGIVLGTGDLSELALGWCTYGVGDQMSHYGVNSGVPKTLMQHLIRWVAASGQFEGSVPELLTSILDTEISPELVPVKAGEKPQSTQASVGPYALQDFTLFHVLRRGRRPSAVAFLAWHAWHDADAGEWPAGFPDAERIAYDLPEIRRWLGVFIQRFFTNQFKRSALPNGPKVLAGGTLSPRGDWRMPSDARGTAWKSELEENVPERFPGR